MSKELELWQFIADRLNRNQPVMLLVVATSSGSSPGRQGYKMAAGADGELCGSIGGGVMEVNLVEQSREILNGEKVRRAERETAGIQHSKLKEQVHQKNSHSSSGMICSGRQMVIFHLLTPENAETVDSIIDTIKKRRPAFLAISPAEFTVTIASSSGRVSEAFQFEKLNSTDFAYKEKLGHKNDLYIIGGGHCALALSELMAKMDFYISLFDDRPELNTIDKNRFADEIKIIESYEKIADCIPNGPNVFVVVMTLGYKSDETVIRQLLDKNFKYFGVLGSKAKMATLLKNLTDEGYSKEKLDRIHTPIGLSINSRTPEEIAVSIAAEIIAVKNR